jgi:hypothetical protein
MGIPAPGMAVEAVGCRQAVLPGQKNVPEDQSFSCRGGVHESGGIRRIQRRSYRFYHFQILQEFLKNWRPFGAMPPLTALLFGYYGMPIFSGFVAPDFIDAMEAFVGRRARFKSAL